MAYFILFPLYNKSEKKIMTYIRLQLNLPSLSIQASTFLAGPPLHPPLSMCTLWMNPKGITATKSYIINEKQCLHPFYRQPPILQENLDSPFYDFSKILTPYK